jgi:pectate lyase
MPMAAPTRGPAVCPDGLVTRQVISAVVTCDEAPVPLPRDERRLHVASHKTIVGLGRGAQLRGVVFEVGASENVIVRNLALTDVNPTLIEAGDAISVAGAGRLWVDHVTFKNISDGFIDVSQESSDLSFSWLKYDGANDAACQGRHPRANELYDALATFHHTLWEHVNGRAPLVTHSLARVHVWNSVVNDDVDTRRGVRRRGARRGQLLRTCGRDRQVEKLGRSWGSGDSAPEAQSLRSGVGSHETAGQPTLEPHDAIRGPPYPTRSARRRRARRGRSTDGRRGALGAPLV